MRTLPASLTTASLLVLPLLAPVSFSSDVEVAPAAMSTTVAPLAAALDSVSTRNIAADIHFIASDELQGRDTPSRGLKIAARFIRARLSALGFEPGAGDGFFHEYPLDFARMDGELTYARLGERELVEGEDYAAWFRTTEHLDVEAPLVWVGEEADSAFEGLDLEGRWAVVVAKDRRSWRKTRRAAQKANALGVVRLFEDDSRDFERSCTAVQRSLEGAVSYPRPKSSEPEKKESASSRKSFPFVSLKRSILEATIEGGLDGLKPGTDLGLTFRDVRTPDEQTKQVTLENVVGLWRGSDPELAHEVIIVSAHYDHVGAREGEVYNGADDNGSGTTGLLALAEALTSYGELRRSVMVIWVSGEEKGLFGSQAWTENPTLPEGYEAVANINIDMIGRNEPDSLLVTPTSEHEAYNGLTRLAERLAPLEGFPVLGDADAYYERSDHYNFRKNLDVPVAFLFSDIHEDYHQASDTPDKIDYDKIRRVARLVMRMLDGMQDDVLEF